MMTDTTTVDYLVVGAGAMGMAFADVIATESDKTIALVDRRARPGGHWNDAYRHVRLHQPSAFYGVNSKELGSGAQDKGGLNKGLYELASSHEVLAYYDHVLNQQLLPSGRVQFFSSTEHLGDGRVRSIVTGTEHQISATTIVDAGYMNVTVPSMRPPSYAVADGVRCEPPNALAHIGDTPDDFVVVGAGKTAMDAVLWLLGNGTDPSAIRWIMPRDSWLLDRAHIQPGSDFAAGTLGRFVAHFEAAGEATSIDDLFARLEVDGSLLRIDPNVTPTMYRCATVTGPELEQLRRIEGIVRLGRVQSITADEIVLDGGTIPTTPNTLHIDCTADGLERRPVRPIFDGDRITLQTVRTCQQVFSAAVIAHVELANDDEAHKNELCTVVQHPDSHIDWLRVTVEGALARARWNADADLAAWLASSRLDASAVAARGASEATLLDIAARSEKAGPKGAMRLAELLARHDAEAAETA